MVRVRSACAFFVFVAPVKNVDSRLGAAPPDPTIHPVVPGGCGLVDNGREVTSIPGGCGLPEGTTGGGGESRRWSSWKLGESYLFRRKQLETKNLGLASNVSAASRNNEGQ
eukprot:CAMPEP_0113539354 /NCGR_PEP_ID=MMETSP0015_2-20120614/7868_1 /TAXON_ID=2838 /ORGANISM="Odontella" /LENGTH=110 /DNA_ID=CAMNT_0000439017 /DNA_START=185 /DNA_END=518 /DNA_ORIENTATION=- /assembly_acc=CAM_ASM_000160